MSPFEITLAEFLRRERNGVIKWRVVSKSAMGIRQEYLEVARDVRGRGSANLRKPTMLDHGMEPTVLEGYCARSQSRNFFEARNSARSRSLDLCTTKLSIERGSSNCSRQGLSIMPSTSYR